MLKNLQRLTRKNIFLPITISVENVNTGVVLQQSFVGHITNITKRGACLFMTKIMAGSFHLFHSIKENDSLILRLTITAPPEKESYTVTACPRWFDMFQDEEHRGFKVGVEFAITPGKKFFHSL